MSSQWLSAPVWCYVPRFLECSFCECSWSRLRGPLISIFGMGQTPATRRHCSFLSTALFDLVSFFVLFCLFEKEHALLGREHRTTAVLHMKFRKVHSAQTVLLMKINWNGVLWETSQSPPFKGSGTANRFLEGDSSLLELEPFRVPSCFAYRAFSLDFLEVFLCCFHPTSLKAIRPASVQIALMSAPERSSFSVIKSSSVTSSASIILLVWIWKMCFLVFSWDRGNSTFLSMHFLFNLNCELESTPMSYSSLCFRTCPGPGL